VIRINRVTEEAARVPEGTASGPLEEDRPFWGMAYVGSEIPADQGSRSSTRC
jgi:hypothetical protein